MAEVFLQRDEEGNEYIVIPREFFPQFSDWCKTNGFENSTVRRWIDLASATDRLTGCRVTHFIVG